jgi:hypothetical protein
MRSDGVVSSSAIAVMNGGSATVNNCHVMRSDIAAAEVPGGMSTADEQAMMASVVAVRNILILTVIPNLFIATGVSGIRIASGSTCRKNSSRTNCGQNLLHCLFLRVASG